MFLAVSGIIPPCNSMWVFHGLEVPVLSRNKWGLWNALPVAVAWTQALWTAVTSSVHTDNNAHLTGLMEGWNELMHFCESILSWIGNYSNVSSLWGLMSSEVTLEEPWAFQVVLVLMREVIFSLFRIFSDFLYLNWSKPSHPYQKGLCLPQFLLNQGKQ